MSRLRLRYLVIALALTAVIFVLLVLQTTWWWYWSWLIAASIVAFLLYGFDKGQASRNGKRVPNLVLHLMAIIGGFIGAFLGRAVFNHKSNWRSNPAFLVILIVSLAAHLALIGWYFFIRTN